MLTSDFEYDLPQELIAQTPIEPRDHSRLIVVYRKTGTIEHRRFYELPDFLKSGDVLIFNDSRVIPARLKGRRESRVGKVEVLLLQRLEAGLWEALARPARRLPVGTVVRFQVPGLQVAGTGGESASLVAGDILSAEVVESREGGLKVLRFSDESLIEAVGVMPLPPYIHEHLADRERYQTIYARVSGSAAAPTAGLHFTAGLLRDLEAKGVEMLFVTLHIGLDTFRPVCEERPEEHRIHREYGLLTRDVAQRINSAITEGRRIVAVGTTTVRLLEAAAAEGLPLKPFNGEVGLFILPGHRFLVANAMITNFHLPRSTLLMLVSAFAGQKLVRCAYEEAISQRYRFYSFGDAMLIV